MGTLTRTISAKGSSASGYWTQNSDKVFSVDVDDSGAISGASISSAKLKLENIKSYSSGNTYFEVYVGGSLVGRATSALQSNSSLHSVEFDLGSLSNTLISGSISQFTVKAASGTSGNKAYYYRSNEGSATVATITAYCTYGDPTPPTTLTLNGTNGDIHVPAGASVTLAWSGGSNGSNNPFTGYQVYKNGGSFGSAQSGTSKTVDVPGAGSSNYYTVQRLGTYSSSAESARRTVYAYSSPTAPRTVQVNNTSAVTVDAGTNVTLSWSGASNGSGNNITGYRVYRATSASGTYTAIGNVITGTSATASAPSTMGQTYYFKIVAVGTYSNSDLSETAVSVTAQTYTKVSPPTSVSADPSVTSAEGSATLSWSGATGGTNTTVASYQIYRSNSADSGYTLLASVSTTSAAVFAPSAVGTAYYFKIVAVANKSGFNSDLSTAYAMLAVPANPNAPIIQGTLSGKSYNARPRVLAQIPTNSIETLEQTITAPGWSASRTGCVQGQKVVMRKDTAYSSSGSSSVTFSNVDSFGGSASVGVTVVHEEPTWTDDPVEAGTTAIKAAHINELREAVDNLRAWYGMTAYSWEEEIVAGVTSAVNWARHAQEIKDQIEAIQTFINDWDSTNAALDVSLPVISTFYAPKADVINKLRQAIMLL